MDADRRRLRIAFAAQPADSMYPPVQGGSLAIWIYQVAKVCARRGHETIIFANHGGMLGARSANSEGIDYNYTPTGLNRLLNKLSRVMSRAVNLFYKSDRMLPSFASAWQDIIYALEIGRRSRQLKCDVVLMMNYSQFAPVIKRLSPKTKICLNMQCEWLTQLDYRLIEKRLSCVDLIIGCSEYITQKIAGRFPQFEKRCVTVPNAAAGSYEVDRSKSVPYYVLFVGRVSPEKGVHVLVKAFHEVLKRFPEAQLHITGGFGSAPYEYMVGLSDDPHVADLHIFYKQKSDGNKDPYATWLENDAGPELGKRIFFDGRIPHGKIEACYKSAEVLVNPSLSESFGMSLVEAMMHRVPVVATRVGGMPYIVDHERTGLLVDPADPQALAAAICEILGDREKAHRFGEAGRAKAIERYSWEKATDVLLEHCRRIVI